ncbi:MAG: hypothetical protein KGI06_05980 [Candidatus Micrarchaeota archaeon]|nr:hypothetical protein [Candidatus Micrarchaeota archaeon]
MGNGAKTEMKYKTEELKLVLDKLDDLEMELLRLRAQLLPKEKMSKKMKKAMEEAEREIKLGNYITGGQLIKKLG